MAAGDPCSGCHAYSAVSLLTPHISLASTVIFFFFLRKLIFTILLRRPRAIKVSTHSKCDSEFSGNRKIGRELKFSRLKEDKMDKALF